MIRTVVIYEYEETSSGGLGQAGSVGWRLWARVHGFSPDALSEKGRCRAFFSLLLLA